MFKIPSPKKLIECESKKPEFLLEDFLPIPKSALTLLSATGGSGKTFLTIQAAIRLVQNPKMKVLLWLSEDPSGLTKYRAEEILNKLNVGTHLNNIDIIDDMPDHLTKENFNEYSKLFSLYNLVILDPLIAFYGGDENSNSQARYFMNLLNKMAKDNIQSFLIIHHSTKPNKDDISKTRGAGAFIDAVRLAYEIKVIENSLEREVSIIKDNYGVSLTYGKSKNIKVLPYQIIIEKEVKENNIKSPNSLNIIMLEDDIESEASKNKTLELKQKGIRFDDE